MATGEGASKVYTKGGDKGKTSLIGGTRVSKAHARLETYGTIDELNSVIGVLRTEVRGEVDTIGAMDAELILLELEHIQNELFNVGALLACEDVEMRAGLPRVGIMEIQSLEQLMDSFSWELKPLKNFILPGGSRSSAQAHIARTVCRRCERLCVALTEHEGEEAVEANVIPYLNRLSDYFFVLARHLNRLQEIDEPIWGLKRDEARGPTDPAKTEKP